MSAQKFEALWQTSLDPKRGLTVVEIMDAVHAGQIKGMYIMGENPAMSDPDLTHAREALAHLEHLVVQDIFLTETAKYADVVLPASAWPEKDGTVTNTNRQVQMGRAALPMPGEARQDWWIIQEIARRIGPGLVLHASARRVRRDEAGDAVARQHHLGAPRSASSAVTYPCDAEDQPGHEIVFGDGFPTAGGRAKLRAGGDHPARRGAGRRVPAGADHRAPARTLAHRRDDAARRGARRASSRRRSRASRRPSCAGLASAPATGSRVATRRGAIELTARADSAVAPGMVFIPFCYAEAAANILTNPQLDPFGKIPEFKFCAARVELARQPRRGGGVRAER